MSLLHSRLQEQRGHIRDARSCTDLQATGQGVQQDKMPLRPPSKHIYRLTRLSTSLARASTGGREGGQEYGGSGWRLATPQWDERSVGERRRYRCVDGSDDLEDSFSFQHCRSEGRQKRRNQSKGRKKRTKGFFLPFLESNIISIFSHSSCLNRKSKVKENMSQLKKQVKYLRCPSPLKSVRVHLTFKRSQSLASEKSNHKQWIIELCVKKNIVGELFTSFRKKHNKKTPDITILLKRGGVGAFKAERMSEKSRNSR